MVRVRPTGEDRSLLLAGSNPAATIIYFNSGILLSMNDIYVETERIRIRPLTVEDAASLFCYRSLNEVSRFQTFQPENLADAVDFLNSISPEMNIQNTWYQLGLFHKADNKHIGDIGIHFLDNPDETEIGITLAPEYWKKGYAAEGLEAVISYIFNTLDKKRITANIDCDNISSRRLFERLGFELTSRADNEVVYRLGRI